MLFEYFLFLQRGGRYRDAVDEEDDDGDIVTEMHNIHQSIRDLTSEQQRIGSELDRERDARRRYRVRHL